MKSDLFDDKLPQEMYVPYLEKKAHELQSLFELANQLGQTNNLSSKINYSMLILMGQYGMESITVFLISDSDEEAISYYSSKGIDKKRIPSKLTGTRSEFCKFLFTAGQPVLFPALENRFGKIPEIEILTRIETAVCIPLTSNNKLIGIISFGPKITKNKEYANEDLSFIQSAIHLISSAIENARLYQKLENNNKHLEQLVEQKTADLREREERFREMALLLPTIIMETNLQQQIRFLNQAGLDAFGINEEDLGKGVDLLVYIHPDERDKFNEFCRNLRPKDQGFISEFRLIFKDNSIATMLVKAIPIMKNAEITGIRWNAMDIKPIMTSIIVPEDAFFQQYHFSQREKEILLLMIQGYRPKDIAKKLFISDNTVKRHIANIYIELDIQNKEEFFEKMQKFQINHFGYESFIFFVISKIIAK